MSKSNFNENEMAAYAQSVEGAHVNEINMPENEAPVEKEQPKQEPTTEERRDLAGQIMKERAEKQQKTTAELHAEREEEIRRESAQRGIGNAVVPIDSLPSKGMFYPVGTKIWISSASLGDIKRWSSMNEDDIQDVMEKMEAILESCCNINFGPDTTKRARWKDLLDLDRLYILFAIHDWTFPAGKNEVKLKVSEKEDIILKKDNVKYIEFPEKLMKFYNEEKRCFSFPVENKKLFADTDGMLDIYMPTIGVSNWLTDYFMTARRRHDNIDETFLSYASILIPDWRNLTDMSYYYDLVDKTSDWGTYEWTLISKVRDIIVGAAGNPTIIYVDKGGVEREVPLYFRNGLKSLFQVELSIDL